MSKTKVFFDTKFTGLHKNTTLISIGLVSECGKTFYAELTDYDASPNYGWTNRAEVIGNLIYPLGHVDGCVLEEETPRNFTVYGTTLYVKLHLSEWLSQFEQIEIWSDCLAYDWVLFNNIFGTAFDIPKNVYYIPFDICTLFKIKGIDADISREAFIGNAVKGNKHNALYDAKVIKSCYEKLTNQRFSIRPQLFHKRQVQSHRKTQSSSQGIKRNCLDCKQRYDL